MLFAAEPAYVHMYNICIYVYMCIESPRALVGPNDAHAPPCELRHTFTYTVRTRTGRGGYVQPVLLPVLPVRYVA